MIDDAVAAIEAKLRPYQREALAALRREMAAGHMNVILCAPTGSGKTLIASYLMARVVRSGKRAIFVVDRLSLLDQTSEVLDGYGIPHGVIQGNHWRWRPYEPIQIASQQTLARRDWPETDLIIVDEAHTVTTTVRKRIAPRNVRCIGLTATPFTKGLGKIYDGLVNAATTNDLIASGFLSEYRIFAASEPDMTGVKVVAGEWEEKATSERAMKVVGDCVVEYLKHGNGRKFICSAVDTAHVDEIARQFNEAGVMTATYTYKVRDEDRAEIVKEFRKPDSAIRGLVTVTAASKGFDVPDIGVVIMARPLRKSLAEHIQFFGRGLRIADGKAEATVLDHSGNSQRFWREWNDFFDTGATELDDGKTKERKKKDDETEEVVVKCPQCSFLHKPRPLCPACGHEYPRREAVKHVVGSLAELVASDNRREQTKELWPQIVWYAKQHRPDENRARGYAFALYRDMTGTWPVGSDVWERAKPVEATPEVQKRIRAAQIRWAKRRRAA